MYPVPMYWGTCNTGTRAQREKMVPTFPSGSGIPASMLLRIVGSILIWLGKNYKACLYTNVRMEPTSA